MIVAMNKNLIKCATGCKKRPEQSKVVKMVQNENGAKQIML